VRSAVAVPVLAAQPAGGRAPATAMSTPPRASSASSGARYTASLGTGLSNAELAAHFGLSEATVKTHVARILAKLRLRDRAQAVVVAYETGLITPGPGGPSAGPGHHL
jgi:DNA-binding CsgD family transcriptional regulator